MKDGSLRCAFKELLAAHTRTAIHMHTNKHTQVSLDPPPPPAPPLPPLPARPPHTTAFGHRSLGNLFTHAVTRPHVNSAGCCSSISPQQQIVPPCFPPPPAKPLDLYTPPAPLPSSCLLIKRRALVLDAINAPSATRRPFMGGCYGFRLITIEALKMLHA